MRRPRLNLMMRWAIVCALALSSVLTTAGDWPGYLHDPQHTGASLDETILSPANVPQLTKLWSYTTGDTTASAPTVASGAVYEGSWDGYEYALDATTGAFKWRTYLGQTSSTASHCVPTSGHFGVTSSAAVQNGVVYVGGGDAYWYALDANTGAVLWKVFTGDNSQNGGHYNYSSPLLYNGDAYIGVASTCDKPLVQGQLLKVDLSTHQIVATFKAVPNGQIGGGIWSTPSIDPAINTIYVSTGTQDGPNPNASTQPYALAMVALDATTLAVKSSWQVPQSELTTDSDWSTTPTIFSDGSGTPLVAAFNKGGYLFAFNRGNVGAGPVWQRLIAVPGACPTCGDGSISSAAFARGTLYMAGNNTTVNGVSYPASVRAFDPATGSILWEHGAPDLMVASLVYANGFIVDGAGKYIEVLDAATGARLYSYTTDGAGAVYGLSIANGVIYAGATDGNVYALGLPATPPPPTPTPPADANCPSGWLCQDIGGPAHAGSETVSGGTYNVTAGGSDIGGTWDQFRFLSQSANGDVQISARLAALSNANAGTKAGLMIRQSSAGNSPFYAAYLTPGNGLVVQYRSSVGGGAVTAVTNLGSAAPPLYLRIQRQGDNFVTATSSDGVSYTLAPGSQVNVLIKGAPNVIMPANVLVGLALTAHSSTTTANAVFDNVSIGALGAPPSTPTPRADANCPAGWSCQDIGNFMPAGGETLNGGVWTVQGAGQDIAGAADQFRYIWQSIAGDGSVSADVIAQTNTNGAAKAGVMIRASADPAAPYYGAFLTPSNGVTVQYRLGQGYFNRTASSVAGVAPIYIQVKRSGSTFKTYTSPDGVTWTYLSGSTVTITMGATVLGGLAVTSRAPGTLSTAQFSNVTLSGAIGPPTATPTPTATPGGPTATATPTPTGPVSGTHSGSVASVGGSDSYVFTPGASGPASIGACAVSTGNRYTVAVYDSSGTLLGSGTTSSYCNWVDTTLNAGQRYTVTTTSVAGTGVYRSAWNVNGAQVVWSLSGSINTVGGSQSVSFPILSTGRIALETCGAVGTTFALYLNSAAGTTLASSTGPTRCQALSYTPGARGLFRLVETAAGGTGAWSGSITTELASGAPTSTPTPPSTATATPTAVVTDTPTPTSTATATPAAVATDTPTPPGGPTATATPTPTGPVSGTHSGSVASVGGSDSYVFTPGASGPASIGACAVSTGNRYTVAVYDSQGTLLGSGTTSSYCNWVDTTLNAGQRYTVTTTSVAGTGVYRSAWNVNGAQVVWSLSGSINTVGGSQSVSFPILSTGRIALETCGAVGTTFALYLNSAAGTTLASSTGPTRCQALSYTPGARGLFRLVETAAGGTGRWAGVIGTY